MKAMTVSGEPNFPTNGACPNQSIIQSVNYDCSLTGNVNSPKVPISLPFGKTPRLHLSADFSNTAFTFKETPKMKNAPKKFAVVVVAIALLAGLTACPNEPELAAPTVAEKYRFTGGDWDDGNFVRNVSTLGESTFTVSGGGIDISYTNVYTTGGGLIQDLDPWAYLYSGNVKIGIVMDASRLISGFVMMELGKESCSVDGYYDISGMQDTHNGVATFIPKK